MNHRDKIRGFILENFLFTDDPGALGDDDSFLEKGIIDSTGIMEVILFLEENFGIQVREEDMTPENFDSVNRIVAYLDKRLAA